MSETKTGHVTTDDGVRLYYEDTGSGIPILFIHEFAGDFRSWEPQVRHFTRLYRCITYNARGYPPSDVPEDPKNYGQDRAVADAIAVMDALGIGKAHICGLSMGGFAAVHLGLKHPDRCRSLLIAGCGYGAESDKRKAFYDNAMETADNFEKQGARAFAEVYGLAASRVQFQNKDPRGWRECIDQFAEHSDKGSANTMRGVQALRPSLFDLEDDLRECKVPALVVTGDEDDACLMPGILMKRTMQACGLLVIPKSGHTINIEEPLVFNRSYAEFLHAVETDHWDVRDPRADPNQILKTK